MQKLGVVLVIVSTGVVSGLADVIAGGGPGPGASTGTMGYAVDGVSLAVTNPQNINANDWILISLGGRPSAGGGCCGEWNGGIAEVLLFDRALTVSEQNQVGVYLAEKYGLTTSYVSEPSTVALLFFGLIGLVAKRVRR